MDVLERIPEEELSHEQKELRRALLGENGIPLCRLVREPRHLNEVNWDEYKGSAIWCGNGTLLMVCKDSWLPTRHASITIMDKSKTSYMKCCIHGERQAAIAETLTYFCSLQSCALTDSLRFNGYQEFEHYCKFDVAALQPKQLAQILDANPTRHLELQAGTWTADQSVILATRPYPLDLKLSTLSGFAFEDGGTAFLDALEKRHSSFGSLDIECSKHGMPLSRTNLERLFRLDELIEKLSFFQNDKESGLLPFSGKVKELVYMVAAEHIQHYSFESLDIATKNLHFQIVVTEGVDWAALLISFFNRVAALGHFEKLYLLMCTVTPPYIDEVPPIPHKTSLVAKALINAIKANPSLFCLDLSNAWFPSDWNRYIESIVRATEGYKGLSWHLVTRHIADDSWREQLLSRNLINVVVSSVGDLLTGYYSIRHSIDPLDRLDHKNAVVLNGPPSVRAAHMTTLFLESMSNDFQFTALVISKSTCKLCEVLGRLNLDTAVAAEKVAEEVPASNASNETSDG